MDTSTYTTDTSPEAAAVQLELFRKMSPKQRFEKMCALSNHVRRMAFDSIRRRHPLLDEDAIRMQFLELVYGKQLAEEVAKLKRSSSVE